MFNFVSNATLAERITGLGTLLATKIDDVDRKVESLNEKVGEQDGRVGKLEAAGIAALAERDTLQRVATFDRQHNLDVEQASWTRWQKLLGVAGVLCGALAGYGGLLALIHHL